METKPKNRAWVKDAAIIFLAVLLLLTFFSNTIMNRSLPEVATQYVTSDAITAKVRGTGTVTANGSYQVKAEQTREIKSVMVKIGDEVQTGDVLFILGEGDSAELEAAKEQLRTLQASYQRSYINKPSFDDTQYKADIEAAKVDQAAAEKTLSLYVTPSSIPEAQLKAAQNELDAAQKKYEALYAIKNDVENIEVLIKTAQDAVTAGSADAAAAFKTAADSFNAQLKKLRDMGETSIADFSYPPEEALQSCIDRLSEQYKTAVDPVSGKEINLLHDFNTACSSSEQAVADKQAALYTLLSKDSEYASAYKTASAAVANAKKSVAAAESALKSAQADFDKQAQLAAIELQDISSQIAKQKDAINKLSGGAENQILAKVPGTIETISFTGGQTAQSGDTICTIEVPDMGYTLSFSVTTDQAKKLRVGNTASITNYYWGKEIIATLSSIKPDPKSPQTSKLLTFDLTGDVNAGSELTVSVGEKSATYDTVVPNSAIRIDNNGSFVLIISAKNSPLGNRYYAKRVDVNVVASDDINSAVTGELNWGDYVITTSSLPVANGDMVRMPENNG